MTNSIIWQLILKDWHLMRSYILLYWFGGFAAVGITVLAGDVGDLIGMILFICALAGAGIHAIFETIINEKKEQNLPFVMSLPVTVREYTIAKIAFNLGIFLSVWLTLSAASYLIFVGDNALPAGTIPFITIILFAVLLAYALMLSVCLVWSTMTPSMIAIMVGNIGTQAYLWWLASLYPIRSVIGGNVAVWNTTTVSVLAIQAALVVVMLVATVLLQYRKKDFI